MRQTNLDFEGLKIIDLTLFGDYCGSGLVGKTNYLYCKEELKRYRGFYDVFGGCGAYCIGYVEKELTKKGKQVLEDILTSLENYPLLNEDIFYQLEEEARQEFIEGTIKEYTRKIDNTLNIVKLEFELSKEEKEYIREFVYESAELENTYFFLPSEKEEILESRYIPKIIYDDLEGGTVSKIPACPDYYFTCFGTVHINNSTIYKEVTIYDFYPEGYSADIMSQIKGGTL